MSVERRPSSSLETRSLLEERPPSYHSTDDVNNSPPPPLDVINKFSRADTCWILAGLWSGVLLGAFDGNASSLLDLLSNRSLRSRNRRRDFINTNRERIQSVKSIFLYRNCVLVICMLFYTAIWLAMSIISLFEPKADFRFRTLGRYPWP
jgi:hypothetical protein